MQVIDSELKVNDIIEGVVTRILPYGLIVSLPNQKQGLVHISQVSHRFIQDINEHISLKDIVKVKVIDIDLQQNKISLSIKDANPLVEQKPPIINNSEKPTKRESNSFEDIMSSWLKDSNEKHAAINKRAKRREWSILSSSLFTLSSILFLRITVFSWSTTILLSTIFITSPSCAPGYFLNLCISPVSMFSQTITSSII